MKKLFQILIPILISINLYAQDNPLWLRYPTISPNGKEILFTFKGDIYKVDASGGKAVQMTTNIATDYKPVWSPDGKTFAFASNRFGNFDIFIMPSQGGNPTRLTFHSGKEIPSSFSPDGKLIIFEAAIQDPTTSAGFPRPYLSELYSVPVSGGRIKQIFDTPVQEAKYNKNMSKLIFQDSKGPENIWRKHQISSATKNIFIFDINNKTYTQLTDFEGEDRDAVFSSSENEIFYLTESFDNNFNIAKLSLSPNSKPIQITKLKTNPVRFLSISNSDELCFGYDGEIYTVKEGKNPVKVNISISSDISNNQIEFISTSSGADEIAVSPDSKEIAFIVRGNIYVSSVDYSTTKQITNTPEEEKDVSFSPDGKSILYASERNKSWNLYQTKKVDENEKYFASSTLLKEEVVLENADETYQPKYSPDGKEIAFFANKTELQVLNLASKKIRIVLPGKYNYSYSDGDKTFQWSPDGKYFLVPFSPNMIFSSDIALVNADGKSEPINLTQSGYDDENPKWAFNGNAMIWESDKQGNRSHGSWGSESDVYIMFFNEENWLKFNMTKEEYEILKEEEKEKEKNKEKDKKTETKEKDEEIPDEKIEPVKFELLYIEDRTKRLTINSSDISDAILSKDGEKLFYLSKFEKGYDLWVNTIRENTTKLESKMTGYAGNLVLNKKGDFLFLSADKNLTKINTSDYSKKTISFTAQTFLNYQAEREYMFEHVWRQMLQKFYSKDMHGVDWKFYKKEYEKFLPHINNNFDFAEMLSEMLGELNASHTGSGYNPSNNGGDNTGELGVLLDFNFAGKGLKIEEVIEKSPLKFTKKEIKPGFIIEKIDGIEITPDNDYYQLLNQKVDKPVLLSFYNPEKNERWNEIIKPISAGKLNQLLYERWVEKRRQETYKLSNGKIGYIHVQGMNSQSFRTIYSDLMGKEFNMDAVVVDTRYNHGGWLHDDLTTLLDGTKYIDFVPRGQDFGYDPINKWVKPSVVLVCEGNYSDGHAFPFAYRALELGKIVGMPVPGTMTAVWWETLLDKTLFFGMPQVGARDLSGKFLENQQLEPDFKVFNDYNELLKGNDLQLKKGVEVLLKKN
jgi:Tol biopolymer transport system component/C-terminal processing protease CtpA/Prc